jgi:hypothetical protein
MFNQKVDEETAESCDQQNAKWTTIESARGTFESDDSFGDVVEIKFPRPVNVKVYKLFVCTFTRLA